MRLKFVARSRAYNSCVCNFIMSSPLKSRGVIFFFFQLFALVTFIDGTLKVSSMDINKIKEKANAMLKAVGLEVVFKAEQVALSAEGKLVDGTIVATPADAFAEGVEVYVVVEGQEPALAPDGEHTLESGEVITVKDGKIVSIMAKSPEKEEETEMENVLKPLVDRIAALEEANQTQAADLKKATDEATSLRKQLADAKGELAKLSKSKGVESVKKEKQTEVELSDAKAFLAERRAQREAINQVKGL